MFDLSSQLPSFPDTLNGIPNEFGPQKDCEEFELDFPYALLGSKGFGNAANCDCDIFWEPLTGIIDGFVFELVVLLFGEPGLIIAVCAPLFIVKSIIKASIL
jgi:hypothetical protein